MKKLKVFTVFGFYRDNDQRAGFTVRAKNPDDAEERAIRDGYRNGGNFVPVAVFRGEVKACDERRYIIRES